MQIGSALRTHVALFFARPVAANKPRLEIVDDPLAVEDDFIKFAVFDFESAERVSVQAFEPFRKTYPLVVSGANWLRVMATQANNGKALRLVQQALGISLVTI